jgi:hypothetical protein
MENGKYIIGGLCGFIAGGILGWIMVRIRDARVRTGRKDSSLDQFSHAALPKLTPAGVVRASRMATLEVIGWVVVLILFIGSLLVLVGLLLQ